MAFTPTNYIYENVLKRFQTLLRTEFSGSFPIYIGEEYKKQRNSHIRIFINEINNLDSKEKSIVNQIDLSINVYLNIKSSDAQSKLKIADVTNRVEQMLFENKLDSNKLYYDGRVEEVIMDSKDDEEVFVDNLRVSRINYSVKIPLKYNTYGFFTTSDSKNFLTSSNDRFLVLN